MASGFVNIAKTSDEIEDALEIEDEQKLEHNSIIGLQQWQYTKINIAVLGQPKSGKSSVINRLRNVKNNAYGAAKVDDNVTGSHVKEYTYPRNSKISIWEIPGLKMQNIEGTTRQDDVDFDQYDFFLIVSEKNFMESDNWFIKEVLQKEKPCFFVRTCIGRSVKTKKSHALEDIRVSCKQNLEAIGVTNPTVFLVDNDDIANNFFEFGELHDQLIPMAESAKMGCIPFSFELTHTDDLMDLKRELLRKRIGEKSLQASKAKTDVERKQILKQEVVFQQQIFEIDKGNLTKYETLFGLPKKKIDKFAIDFDTRVGSVALNVIRFDKVDDRSRSSRNFSWYFWRVSDCFSRMKRDHGATYMCKHCKQILEESLEMVFKLRNNLNKEVLTHLVIEKRKERE